MSNPLKGVCVRMYRYKFEPTASACPIFERREDADSDSPEQCQFCKHYEREWTTHSNTAEIFKTPFLTLIDPEYCATYSSANGKRGILLVEGKEIVERLHPLLPNGFKLTRMEDRSAYLQLQWEDERARKADIIKPSKEDTDDITVISDFMTSEKSLKSHKWVAQRLETS